MEALKTYLRETRTTPKAFAKLIGVDVEDLDDVLSGATAVDVALAQRMVDATGGALLIGDFVGNPTNGAADIVDFRSRLAGGAEIDTERLAGVLAEMLPALIGGARRKGDRKLPGLAAEAAANTYLALSTITTRAGADRLAQALRPVVAEILEELSAPAAAHRDLEATTRRAAALYFQALPEKRRA